MSASDVMVVGASGFIGSYLFEKFKEEGLTVLGTYYSNPYNSLERLDMTNRDQVNKIVTKSTPDTILLPAANPNVEYCEEHKELTWNINVKGTENIVKASERIGSKIVFFSSDYVFDGLSGPYSEEDIPNPINEYGRQKLGSEKIVSTIDNSLILRITVVYGWERNGKNFVERLVRNLIEGNRVKVPIDQIGSPTYVKNIADATFELVDKNVTGLFHLTGKNLVDRCTFAREVAEVFGLNDGLIVPVPTKELGQKAKRPLNAGMKVDKIEKFIETKLLGYKEGLKRMKGERKEWAK